MNPELTDQANRDKEKAAFDARQVEHEFSLKKIVLHFDNAIIAAATRGQIQATNLYNALYRGDDNTVTVENPNNIEFKQFVKDVTKAIRKVRLSK